GEKQSAPGSHGSDPRRPGGTKSPIKLEGVRTVMPRPGDREATGRAGRPPACHSERPKETKTIPPQGFNRRRTKDNGLRTTPHKMYRLRSWFLTISARTRTSAGTFCE